MVAGHDPSHGTRTEIVAVQQFQTHGIDLRQPVPVTQTETVSKLMEEATSDIVDAEVVE